jgi:hypothetical protein
MATYQILDQQGAVLNTIEASAEFMAEHYPPVPIIVDNWEGPNEFWPQYIEVPSEPEAAPDVCTMAQARKALLTAGITAAQVEAALADNPMGLIDWEFQTEVRRSSPLVQSVGAALGLSVDDLFRLAVTL